VLNIPASGGGEGTMTWLGGVRISEHARFLAERIPNARLSYLPGNDIHPGVGYEAAAEQADEFLTGTRAIVGGADNSEPLTRRRTAFSRVSTAFTPRYLVRTGREFESPLRLRPRVNPERFRAATAFDGTVPVTRPAGGGDRSFHA